MSVRIYADESVPVAIAAGLQRRAVDALSARDAGNLGLTDRQQLAYATANHMAEFTHDADFLQLAHEFHQTGEHHWGVIYVRQNKLAVGEIIRRLKEISDLREPDDLRDHVEFL